MRILVQSVVPAVNIVSESYQQCMPLLIAYVVE